MAITETDAAQLAENFKQVQKFIWSQGDYARMSARATDSGPRIANLIGARPGLRVLDVAAGDGNIARAVATRGAEVTATDLTPQMVELGRASSAAAGLAIRWAEADAEALPFPDGAFDASTSAFGAMFAPRPEVAARELVRVIRPGGVAAMANWTPDSFVARFAETIASALPARPPLPSPAQWGDRQIATARFAQIAERVETEVSHETFRFGSKSEALGWFEEVNGPLIAARSLLREAYGDLRERVRQLIAQLSTSSEGTVEIRSEYLLVLAYRGHGASR